MGQQSYSLSSQALSVMRETIGILHNEEDILGNERCSPNQGKHAHQQVQNQSEYRSRQRSFEMKILAIDH
eukprot:scaffold1377_cov198-Ochromonas_danica.AAC.12